MNQDEIVFAQHSEWLRRTLADPSCTLLIFEAGHTSIGVVRIERSEYVELSWTVAPEHRGKGFGRAMVAAASATCRSKPTLARIKRDNRGSQRIAQYAGFVLAEDGELQIWRRNPVADRSGDQ